MHLTAPSLHHAGTEVLGVRLAVAGTSEGTSSDVEMDSDNIDGDKSLDVQICVYAVGDTMHKGAPIEVVKSVTA